MDIQETQSKVTNKHHILRKVGKYSLRTLIGIICLVVCLLIIGVVYEQIGEYIDAKTYPCAGKMESVSTSNMDVFAKGVGQYTVVFGSGNGTHSPYVDFYPLYNEISKYTRTVVYERPGYGWSEVTDTPRDIDIIAQEIHTALINAGEKPPFILVGHSIASLEVIRFAQMYKNEVAGIITIDAGNPGFYTTFNAGTGTSFIYKLLKYTGILRIMLNYTNYYLTVTSSQNELRFIPDNLKLLDIAMIDKCLGNKDFSNEVIMLNANAKKVVSNGHLGDIPLRILTADSSCASSPDWKSSQEDFTKWSTNSTQKVVDGVGHYIHEYKPEVVNDEIIKLLNSMK